MAKNLVYCALFLLLWPPLNLDSLSTIKKLHHSPLFLSAHSSSIQYPDNRKFLLFIIDFDDFMCMNCLESFLTFCQRLPPHILEENAWGILVLDQDNKKKQAKTTLKIAQKKLRGFIHVHRIPFPIIIDTHNMFHSSVREGTALLVFDNQERSISRCLFPLSKEESERIMMFLLKDNNH